MLYKLNNIIIITTSQAPVEGKIISVCDVFEI